MQQISLARLSGLSKSDKLWCSGGGYYDSQCCELRLCQHYPGPSVEAWEAGEQSSQAPHQETVHLQRLDCENKLGEMMSVELGEDEGRV